MEIENDDENEESFSPKAARRELILYLLRRYGSLQTKEIAQVMGYTPRTIRRALKELEKIGEVEGEKIGRSYVWSPREESKGKWMYF